MKIKEKVSSLDKTTSDATSVKKKESTLSRAPNKAVKTRTDQS